MAKKRPLGITVLAIAQGIGAFFVLRTGIVFLVSGEKAIARPLSGSVIQFLDFIELLNLADHEQTGTLGLAFTIWGCLLVISSVLIAILGFGLWTLKSWSWQTMIFLQFLSIFASFFGLFLDSGQYAEIYALNLAIALPPFFYLSQRNVKQAFGVKDPTFKL